LDALRYSQVFQVGSARFNSMGGAFGALGADPTVISTNPAGLGVFQRSELSASPSLFLRSDVTEYLNNQEREQQANFNFGNVSYTNVSHKERSTGWVSSTWQISYSRINNLHGTSVYSGTNNSTSIIDDFYNELNSGQIPVESIGSASFNTQLAWETFLVDTFNVGTSGYQYYVNLPPIEDYTAQQRREIERSGAQGEVTFGYSGNYNNRETLRAEIVDIGLDNIIVRVRQSCVSAVR
jgi:hypothetical protein